MFGLLTAKEFNCAIDRFSRCGRGETLDRAQIIRPGAQSADKLRSACFNSAEKHVGSACPSAQMMDLSNDGSSRRMRPQSLTQLYFFTRSGSRRHATM